MGDTSTTTGQTGPIGPTGPMGNRTQLGDASLNSITSATTVLFGNIINPSNNSMNLIAGTSSITCSTSGVYEVVGIITWNVSTSQLGKYQLFINVNGVASQTVSLTRGRRGIGIKTPSYIRQSINAYVSATVGSIITISVTASNTTSVNLIETGPEASCLFVRKIA